MEFPLEVSVKGEGFSWEEVEQEVQKKAIKLGKYAGDIIKMRVVVDTPHRRRNEGIHHLVKIEVSLPGKVIVVNRDRQKREHENIRTCLRDAFDAARRKVEDYVRVKRHKVKQHEEPSVGYVADLFPNMDYGLIRTPDGYEVYFHRNSVLGAGFDSLEQGEQVRFTSEMGDEGPQASSVISVQRRQGIASA